MTTYPFDDNEMKYDYDKHRYILTQSGVEERLKINLQKELNLSNSSNPADEVNAFLNDVSLEVYDFVYAHVMNKYAMEYLIAKKPLLRETIKDAMLEQAKYMYINGSIANESGIDFTKGTAIPLDEIRGERRISPYAKNLLSTAGLLYSGRVVVRGFKFREGY